MCVCVCAFPYTVKTLNPADRQKSYSHATYSVHAMADSQRSDSVGPHCLSCMHTVAAVMLADQVCGQFNRTEPLATGPSAKGVTGNGSC